MVEITEDSLIRVKSDRGIVNARAQGSMVIIRRYDQDETVRDVYQLNLGQAEAFAYQLGIAVGQAKIAQMTRKGQDARDDGLVQSRFE